MLQALAYIKIKNFTSKSGMFPAGLPFVTFHTLLFQQTKPVCNLNKQLFWFTYRNIFTFKKRNKKLKFPFYTYYNDLNMISYISLKGKVPTSCAN